MEEIWKKWEPVANMAQKYYVDSIQDNIKGLNIILSDSKHDNSFLEILFNYSVHGYRSTDESFRQKIFSDLEEKHITEFYSKWTLFKVTNSEYLKWISDQSFSISESENLIHFVIMAADSIVDIVAAYEPQIKIYKVI